MPVLCEMNCIDIPDPYEAAMQVLHVATPEIGEVREIELRGTRVVYEAVSNTSVRILQIFLGDVPVGLNDPTELAIEEEHQIDAVVGRIWNSDPDIGMSAIMLADGHITYRQDPPEPGTSVMVRSQHLAPKEGEILFG